MTVFDSFGDQKKKIDPKWIAVICALVLTPVILTLVGVPAYIAIGLSLIGLIILLVSSNETRDRMRMYASRQWREWKEGMDSMSTIFVLIVTIFFFIFLIFPLVYISYEAFIVDDKISFARFFGEDYSIFTAPDRAYFSLDPSDIDGEFISHDTTGTVGIWKISGIDWAIINNTIIISLGTTLFSTILGVLLAYIITRYEFYGKGIIRHLLVIPLIIPPFVSGVGIKKILFSEFSTLNLLFCANSPSPTEANPIFPLYSDPIVISGMAAVIIVQSLHFYTLVYLNATSAFANIDPSLEESAENLGANHRTLVRSISLPLALPGIAAGAILTFILSVEDVGTPIIFQGTGDPTTQVDNTLAYQIFRNIFDTQGNLASWALALSVVLLVTAMTGFLIIRKYVGLKQYAMLSKGGIHNPRIKDADVPTSILFYAFLIPLLAIALTPHLGVLLLAFGGVGAWGAADKYPNEFTMDNFDYILNKDEATRFAIQNTLVISLLAIILIIILGVFAAYVLARKSFPGKMLLDAIVTMPIAIPGIVLGAAYFYVFIGTPLDPLDDPLRLLVFSFTVRRFPFTVRAVFAGLQQLNIALEEVSWNLGGSQSKTLRAIVLPLISLNILAGALMSFVYSMAEVSTSIALIGTSGGNKSTIPTQIAERFTEALYGSENYACALGVLLMIGQIISIVFTNRILKDRGAAITGI
ncbi:MAG: ABC transporter permease [Candidatus Heimdallarchaeota archaeon]